jgi:hypothetical protein
MECDRGSVCKEQSHTVKTIDKAREWFPDAEIIDLPLRIEQRISSSGRIYARFFNKAGKLIGTKG